MNWLYFGDDSIIFNRISENSTMTNTVCKLNKTYLTCEITFQKNDNVDKMNARDLANKVIQDLLKVKIINSEKEVDLTSENKENFVYPVQFIDYKSELSRTRQVVEKFAQLYSLGTGGEFDYADSQILFHKSMDLVDILEQKNENYSHVKKMVITNKLNSKVQLAKKLVGENPSNPNLVRIYLKTDQKEFYDSDEEKMNALFGVYGFGCIRDKSSNSHFYVYLTDAWRDLKFVKEFQIIEENEKILNEKKLGKDVKDGIL